MIKNPVNDEGEPLCFTDALAPDVPRHVEDTYQHIVRMAGCDVRYARWTAGTMGKECPEWYGGLLERLDAHLAAQGVAIPPRYVEPESKLPPLLKGRRGLPPKRFFHDTLSDL